MGLAMVKSLAELYGGGIAIDSEVGIGTTVTVRFPTERVISGRQATRRPTLDPAAGAGA